MIEEIIIGIIMMITAGIMYLSIIVSNSMYDRLKKVIEVNPKCIEQWKINTKYIEINYNKKLLKCLTKIIVAINVIALISLIIFAIFVNSNKSEIAIFLFASACGLSICTIGLNSIIILWRSLVISYVQSKLPFWA